MGATTNGYPYPESTDPVAQGANAIKALAQKIESNLAAAAAGRTPISLSNASSGSATVTFPSGRFKSAPAVAATCESSSFFAAVSSVSATSMTLWLRRYEDSPTTQTLQVDWVARSLG